MYFFAQKTTRGYLLGEVVSSLQKTIRRGEEDQAVFWAAELEQSGFGKYLWNRLEIILTEDIGVAWIEGPAVIGALRASYDRTLAARSGNLGWRLYVIHAVMLMARAPKSRRVDIASWSSYGNPGPKFPIPDYALDFHTARGKSMGRQMGTPKGDSFWWDEASHLENRDESLGPFCEDGCKYHPYGKGCGVELEYHEAFHNSTEAAMDMQGRPGKIESAPSPKDQVARPLFSTE